MQANKTVTINGRQYDAVTGLPVKRSKVEKPKQPVERETPKQRGSTAATTVHATPQRSHTLHRRAAKKPGLPKRPQAGRHMDITPSSRVARFAAHPVATFTKSTSTPDVKPKTHPLAAKAAAQAKAKATPAVPPTLKQIKEATIANALAKPSAKPPKRERTWRWSRRFTIVTAIFALLIIGAFLTYTNIPSLSVGFAAAQAGIKATYPEYKPDGYRLEQPVTFSDGEVTLVFASNSGAGKYTVVQTRSSWDSSAVLDNVVKKAAGDNYVTTQERGLTIYSYGSNAAWVNGGILYTIKSTAPLSGEQIRHIATSL